MTKMAKRLAAIGIAAATGAVALGAAAAPASAQNAHDGEYGATIVGGDPAEEGEYPWMVRLSMGCGGSLLTDQIVLTAAHCVDGSGPDDSITAQYGSVDLNSPDISEYQSEEVFASPAYAENQTEDWALIKLSEPVADAKLLPIAETGDLDEGDFEIMGWGADSEGGAQQELLLKATVPSVSDADCEEAYGSDLDAASMLCAGYPEGGVDSCQGDSGGPMVARDEAGEPVQVGIVSWGAGCARPDSPGVYTQVSNSAADIQAAAEEMGAGLS